MGAGRKRSWGGPRKGAGRKPDPQSGVRRNRVTVTLTDSELDALHKLAEERDLPVGTTLYELVKRRLRTRS